MILMAEYYGQTAAIGITNQNLQGLLAKNTPWYLLKKININSCKNN